MNKYLKYFSAITFLFIIFSSCKKDDIGLGENELFARLQSGSGSWKVEEVETFSANSSEPTITKSNPSNDFFHFYIGSKYLFGDIADFAYGSFYSNDYFNWSSKIDAESDRVAFVTGFVGEGTVWTVEVNKRTKQVWNSIDVNTNIVTRITLKKCDCEFPNPTGESGG